MFLDFKEAEAQTWPEIARYKVARGARTVSRSREISSPRGSLELSCLHFVVLKVDDASRIHVAVRDLELGRS